MIFTPDLSASILPGITRDSIITLARGLGYEVVLKPLIRTDLYVADEVFMTGTAAEVTPIRSVDDQEIGDPGPITRAIQTAYLDTVTGRDTRFANWLEHVPTSVPSAPDAPGFLSRSPTSASERRRSSSRCSVPGAWRSGR